MEQATLTLFCALLIACVTLDGEVLFALTAGLALFVGYALKRGFSPRRVLVMCGEGIWDARNVLLNFLLIGVLTAFWRAAGTIAVIVCYAGTLIRPSLFLLMTFLLNSLVSVLTGTCFGTSATIGVICATMGEALGLPAVLVGGAVLSGAFFGDRCSPVSTSAMLVAEMTGTSIFDNIRVMFRSSAVPMAITCLIYGILGWLVPYTDAAFDLTELFGQAFRLHWTALLPAAVILTLSALRVPVRKTMLASILTAIPLCLAVQGMPPLELAACAWRGYRAGNAAIAAMMDGGGIRSMVRVAVIVCLSSAYAGIFRETSLLDGVQRRIQAISRRVTSFGAMLLTSVLTSAVACNQTLAIMLTEQLCEGTEPDRAALARHLENSVVVVSGLIPWSIAGGVPLASIGAPSESMLFACFLYVLPLWELGCALRRKG